MLPISDLLLFALAALGLVLSPGPNMIYLISRSITQGRRAGLISLVGILVGFLVHIFLVSFGLTAVFLAIPMAYEVLRWLGIGYLLYLAWEAIKPGSISPFETKNLPHAPDRKLFQMGFLTNALNPKTTIFVVSLFMQVVQPSTRVATQIGYGAFISAAHILWFALVALFFSAGRVRDRILAVRHWIDRVFGVLLVGFGLLLARSSVAR